MRAEPTRERVPIRAGAVQNIRPRHADVNGGPGGLNAVLTRKITPTKIFQ
jgi:hypothetical protein